MNQDQKNDFLVLKSRYMNEIATEPALTDEGKADYMKLLNNCEDEEVYQMLRTQSPQVMHLVKALDNSRPKTKQTNTSMFGKKKK